MADFCLSCCSTVDLDPERMKQRNLRYVCFQYTLDGVVGTMLNICPLLNMDKDGHLAPREKLRGKRRVINRIVEQMTAHARDGLNDSGKCFMCHSLCLEDAQAVASMVEEQFSKLQGQVEIFPIGTTIGSHTGPGAVALFFWGDKRND